jgi:hypothetical protein
MSETDYRILAPTFEDGLGVKISQYGQLVISMNTTDGRVLQEMTLHPLLAFRLCQFLVVQDWFAIHGIAMKMEPTLAELWPAPPQMQVSDAQQLPPHPPAPFSKKSTGPRG